MKKFLSIILTLFVLFGSIDFVCANTRELDLIGKSAILIDATTGEILYEKNIHDKHYPASTTKIMTAILTLENLDLSEKLVIDEEASFTGGSRIYLLEGEDVTAEEVMYGMMLESANDAAVAFAKNIAGTVEAFAKMMNEKAAELGALNTNFVNPHGLHDEAHVSTAYDLAMIAKYAMKNETFRHFVSTYQYTMEATNLQETRYFYNTNRMLYDNLHTVTVNGQVRGCKYEGVTGIKTGYTSQAGGCLVAGAKRGETELIAVTMASTDMGRFQDCITLLDYGFENYKTVNVLESGKDLGDVPVQRGSVKRVKVILPNEVHATLPAEASNSLLRTEVELFDSVEAPVEQGQKAGIVKLYLGDELIGEYDAVIAEFVDRGGWLSVIGIEDSTEEKIQKVVIYSVVVLLLLLVMYILVKRHQVKVRRIRRQQRQEKYRRLKEQEIARWDDQYWSNRYNRYY
ncbi:MAG TPA: D-alanyl-D-alanine carboxypeptidase [Clostridiales bacterium UBA9856]|jgi:D-alanyl-D-alanine carboxypeptidase (penicillin-binding protein 5/6)|nr:D-alanyl-D-alanine carboxypeptidase [Clostridiales bacterium UBA9856]HOA42443.1 D-alanyl-D-alanine carboxypeptidase family protein [Bacillota bacterium]